MRILTLLAMSVLLSACSDPCTDEVINKATDSANKTDFIHVKRNCGATAGYSHQIYIVASGAPYEDENPIFSADKVDNLVASWKAGSNLEISYGSARIFNFTNFWQSAEVDNFNYVVKVVLSDGT